MGPAHDQKKAETGCWHNICKRMQGPEFAAAKSCVLLRPLTIHRRCCCGRIRESLLMLARIMADLDDDEHVTWRAANQLHLVRLRKVSIQNPV